MQLNCASEMLDKEFLIGTNQYMCWIGEIRKRCPHYHHLHFQSSFNYLKSSTMLKKKHI